MNERLNDAQPVWGIVEHQGRTLAWLARATEFSESHIWAIKGGRFQPSPKFRAACARALDLPEWVLFNTPAGGSVEQAHDQAYAEAHAS